MSLPKPRACMTIGDLEVGMKFSQPYTITDEDIRKFGEISGDFNPAHFNDEYAASTRFGNRIAHGMISVAKFSGIFGMDMPGLGTIWASQSAKFLAPVQIGQPYTAIAEVKEVTEKSATFETYCVDKDGNRVLEGEGVVFPIPAKVRDGMGDSLDTLLDK